MRANRLTLITALALLLVTARDAMASDGVLEINQACAVQTGCFAGDFPGFPVAIDGLAGRSFLLTSDLVVPDQNTHAVRVFADNVTVDLAGFTIRGATSCTGTPASCSSTGTGQGVAIGVAAFVGLEVRNGSIVGMGDHAVVVGNFGVVRDVRARGNGGDGIAAGEGSMLQDNLLSQNGGDGIRVGGGSTILGNTAYGNGDDGFEVGKVIALDGAGSMVHANTSSANGKDGFLVASGTSVVQNSASKNGEAGIRQSDGARGVLAQQNASYLNSTGILGTSFHANVVVSNTSFPTVGGQNRGRNVCGGPLTTDAFCSGSPESSPEILALCPGGPNC